jgi:hypothetical protein
MPGSHNDIREQGKDVSSDSYCTVLCGSTDRGEIICDVAAVDDRGSLDSSDLEGL